MPRGGKRSGAGAPRGNMNALKTGSRSLRLNALLEAMSEMDVLQTYMLDIRRKQQAHQKQASRLIRAAMLELLQDITNQDPYQRAANNPIIAFLLESHFIPEQEERASHVNQTRNKQSKKKLA